MSGSEGRLSVVAVAKDDLFVAMVSKGVRKRASARVVVSLVKSCQLLASCKGYLMGRYYFS